MDKMREKHQSEINALMQLLSGTDYKAIKHSEGAISDEEYETIRLQRQRWRERIRELEAQAAALDAGTAWATAG